MPVPSSDPTKRCSAVPRQQSLLSSRHQEDWERELLEEQMPGPHKEHLPLTIYSMFTSTLSKTFFTSRISLQYRSIADGNFSCCELANHAA